MYAILKIALMQQNNVTTVLSLSKLEKKIIKIIIVMFKKRSIDEFKYNRRISCTRGTAMVLVKCNCLIQKVRSNMIVSHCRATSYRKNYHFSMLK